MSSNLDMKEAVRILAAEKGISEESLLQVLADALVSAYKRRPGAADEMNAGARRGAHAGPPGIPL